MAKINIGKNKTFLVIIIATLTLLIVALSVKGNRGNDKMQYVMKSYSKLVYKNYQDSYNDAVKLKESIDVFLANPNQENLELARNSWLVARDSYGQTEAFRFYGGPIDFYDEKSGKEGPEGRLNAWPLNEAYIDYVDGNLSAGIINEQNVTITKELLIEKNQSKDEADVSTGYHAIEFLLWGQDLSLDSAGKRSFEDYIPNKNNNNNRREYLRIVTDLLVDDLKFLVESWDYAKDDSYANQFIKQDPKVNLTHILSSLATLSSFELASERLATALDSGDQEDEHSCFSDNTHNDFIYNIEGIENVYFAKYNGSNFGKSIHDLVMKKDKKLAEEIKQRLEITKNLANSLPSPIDREILNKDANPENKKKAEELVKSMQIQGELFKKAGALFGIDVEIKSE